MYKMNSNGYGQPKPAGLWDGPPAIAAATARYGDSLGGEIAAIPIYACPVNYSMITRTSGYTYAMRTCDRSRPAVARHGNL